MQNVSPNDERTPSALGRAAPKKFRIWFTCKVCEHRNSHLISRLAYQQGIVIATCPGCGSRHLLADKTGLLDRGIWDVEMLAEEGESVVRLGLEHLAGSDPADVESALTSSKVSQQIRSIAESPELADVPKIRLTSEVEGVVEALPQGLDEEGRSSEVQDQPAAEFDESR